MSKRSFILGEEWLYYKLYCGVKTSDILLLELVDPLIHELMTAKLIDKWFFVRFYDPNPHLRIRLNIISSKNYGEIIEICARHFRSFIEGGTLWCVQADTYFRELERYGHNSIDYAEEIFYFDSNLIISLLKQKNDVGIYLWGILKSVDSFLNLFDFSRGQKQEFYKSGRAAYNSEFGLSYKQITNIISIISQKYLPPIDKDNSKLNSAQKELCSIIAERNKHTSQVVKKILQLDQSQKLEIPLSILIYDYVHMFFNKAFDCQQRSVEFIGYNLKYLNKVQ